MYSDSDLNVEYMFFLLTINHRSREKDRKIRSLEFVS